MTPELEKVIARESTNLQWTKLAMNVGMVILLIISKIIRGPGGGEESSFGLKICESSAWVTLIVMVFLSFLVTVVAARIANKDN